MHSRSFPFRLGALAILVIALPVLRAEDAPPTQPTPAAASPGPVPATTEDRTIHKINGIFDVDLPKTERKGAIRFIVHPHLGDFTRRSYVRVPLGIRWGVNDHMELTATVEPYIEHGLKSGSPGNGIGDFELGGKYAFQRWFGTDYDASVGFNLRRLVGSPPLDMTDGYHHYSPYLTVSRKSERIRDMTWFANGALDFMEKSSVAGTFRKDDP